MSIPLPPGYSIDAADAAANALLSGAQPSAPAAPSSPSSLPSWLLPVGIVLAAALVVALVDKK